MKAIDTNVLVYALVDAGPHHKVARKLVVGLAEGQRPWAIPWPCVYECLRVVTHPRVFDPPMPVADAIRQLEALFDSPTVMVLHETRRHFRLLEELLDSDPSLTGNLVHDAHIAVLCMEHGITTIVTGDSDFHRFPGLLVENPFSPSS